MQANLILDDSLARENFLCTPLRYLSSLLCALYVSALSFCFLGIHFQ